MNSDRKKTGQIPRWMGEKMGTTVANFTQLNIPARSLVIADLAKMCGYTLVPIGAAPATEITPDKGRGRRDKAEKPPNDAKRDVVGQGPAPVATVKRGDKTPAIRLDDSVRLSPVVVSYEAIKRSDRTKEPGKTLLVYTNILSSSFRRYSNPARKDPDAEKDSAVWKELVEAPETLWATAEFQERARKSFGGIPKTKGSGPSEADTSGSATKA